jgi:hypothetical protein
MVGDRKESTVAMTKFLIALATMVAIVAPAAGGAEIPKVYRGDWCWPVIHHGPFYNPGRCRSDEDEAWIKITASNVNGWLRIRNLDNVT